MRLSPRQPPLAVWSLLGLLVFCLVPGPAHAVLLGNYTSHELAGQSLVVRAGTPAVRITPYADGIVRISLLTLGTALPDTSPVVVLEPQDVAWTLTETDSSLELSMGSLLVRIAKFPVRLSFHQNGMLLVRDQDGPWWDGMQRGLRLQLTDDRIHGTGERALPLDLRGRRLSLYNSPSFCYGYGAENLNITMPYLHSSRGWSLFADNHWPGVLDIGHTASSVLEWQFEGGELTYFLLAAETPAGQVEQLTLLTGRQPLPPRWALGYLQSRYGYESEGEARSIVSAFRSRGIPLDALIIDLYWFGWGQMGDLNWDYSHWPNPVGMLQDFDTAGVQTILITEPYILTSSSNYAYTAGQGYLTPDSTGQPVVVTDFWAGNAGLLDITHPPAAEWFWNQYHPLAAQGVEGWWTDLGEPEVHPPQMLHAGGPAAAVHNIYSLLWARLLHEQYTEHFPQQRLFNLIRSGYTGMQRYSTFPWSGDVQRTFEGLRAQVPLLLHMGISGVGYLLSDIGGFSCAGENPELYVRWMQFGAFCPVMRAHGWQVPTEPIFYDSLTAAIATDYIRLRYSLLPYIYTLAWQNTLTGMPLARPLFFDHPQDPAAVRDDEYLWGPSFLVAPVMEAGQTSRSVYLPAGMWMDYWSETAYSGPRWVTVNAPLERLPLFVRAGSLIPMTPVVHSTQRYNADTLSIHYYPDPAVGPSTFTLYHDDGISPAALNSGAYETLEFAAHSADSIIVLTTTRTHDGYMGAPLQRRMEYVVHRIPQPPQQVRLGGTQLPWVPTPEVYGQTDSAAYYDAARRRLQIHFPWDHAPVTLEITGSDLLTVVQGRPVLPAVFTLHPAFPNPFNASTTIRLDLAEPADVVVEIFNTLGQRIFVEAGRYGAGSHHRVWNGRTADGSAAATGLYLCRVRTGRHTALQKLLLLR